MIAWRTEAWKEEVLDNLCEKTREGHRRSDEHWNHFKGNVGETSERWGVAHMGFFERIDTILNRNELNFVNGETLATTVGPGEMLHTSQ